MKVRIDRKKFVINGLRQLTRRWPPKYQVEKAATKKVQEGFYKNGNPKYRLKVQCNMCKEWVSKKERHMDHIEPVVDLAGFTTFDEYIERMFPYEEGWQVLCISCHQDKTNTENSQRVRPKKKKTKKKKKLDKSEKV